MMRRNYSVVSFKGCESSLEVVLRGLLTWNIYWLLGHVKLLRIECWWLHRRDLVVDLRLLELLRLFRVVLMLRCCRHSKTSTSVCWLNVVHWLALRSCINIYLNHVGLSCVKRNRHWYVGWYGLDFNWRSEAFPLAVSEEILLRVNCRSVSDVPLLS